jgi:hypothetical protein
LLKRLATIVKTLCIVLHNIQSNCGEGSVVPESLPFYIAASLLYENGLVHLAPAASACVELDDSADFNTLSSPPSTTFEDAIAHVAGVIALRSMST